MSYHKSMTNFPKISYPAFRRAEDVVDDYHGTVISDPYRWLEDPDADETKAFVDKQNEIFNEFIEKCQQREPFRKKIEVQFNYPKYGTPMKKGDNYFYFYNSGLQNQSVLYVQDSLEAEGKVFWDPNAISPEGDLSLRTYSFSEDGKYIAMGLSWSGSDWMKVKIARIEGQERVDLEDELSWVKFTGLTWTHDHQGFFYNRYPEPEKRADGTETDSNLHHKMYYHRLGDPQSKDRLIFETPEEPRWMSGAEISDDGKHLMMSISKGTDPVNRLYTAKLAEDGSLPETIDICKIVDNFDAEFQYVANEENRFIFKSNLNASNYKLLEVDIEEGKTWKDYVGEKDSVLEWATSVAGDKLVLTYLEDVKHRMHLHHIDDGKEIGKIPIDIGTIMGFSGKKKDTRVFYQFTSFTDPGTVYYCDLDKAEIKPVLFRRPKVPEFDVDALVTEQVFVPSKDGTKIPMFIVHHKDIKLDGTNPCLQYGYGGFNISVTPSFAVSRAIFINNLRGVFALANIRGGGEYGEDWHQGGCLANKQNCFDDFAACSQYLIDKKYTSSSRLVVNGGSNGGLLVAASLNQRPDLYAGGVAQVGVMDMLRFHKFTIGHAWTTDYGCSDNPEQFKWLIKYSPLHNVKVTSGQQYPSCLLLTGDHDDRVVPLHSLKLMATLQEVHGKNPDQTNPILIRVDTKSGHGAGKPTAKMLDEAAEIYGYVSEITGATWHD
eukprot:Clim_evm55s152 gene=Clim_evmTU55s152